MRFLFHGTPKLLPRCILVTACSVSRFCLWRVGTDASALQVTSHLRGCLRRERGQPSLPVRYVTAYCTPASSRFLLYAFCVAFCVEGGVIAFVAAVMVRPRGGRFDAHGKPCKLPQQSPALTVLGTLMLWAGWFFFNASGVRSFSAQPDSVRG